jgi:DNA mismatch endonuclease (patch repair protein)
MSSVRGKNTGPEIVVRRLVHRMGYRFRLHRKDLPGKPDLVFSGKKKIIFVHGCFWHGHRCRFGRPPKSKLDFWLPKLKRNKNRDRKVRNSLRKLGWNILIVWQCDLKNEKNIQAQIKNFLG